MNNVILPDWFVKRITDDGKKPMPKMIKCCGGCVHREAMYIAGKKKQVVSCMMFAPLMDVFEAEFCKYYKPRERKAHCGRC
jgi:hypothetical protein